MTALQKKSKLKYLIFSFITALVSFSVSLFAHIYTFNDDYWLSMVLNCLYSDDNYCLFVSPFFCSAVKFLHNILPSADCYLLLIRTACFFSIWLIAYYTVSNRQKLYITVPFLIVLSFICTAGLTYTVITTYLICVGIFFCIGFPESRVYYYGGILLMLFGFIFRTQSALLSLPFIFLELAAVIFGKIKNKTEIKKVMKNLLRVTVPVAVCIIAVLYSQAYPEINNNYKDGLQYNSVRTEIVDYPMKKWEKIEADTQGISENDYNAVTSWIFFDTDNINTDFMNRIVTVGSKPVRSFTVKNAYTVIIDVFRKIVKSEYLMSYFLLLCVMLSFSLISKIPLYKKLKNLAACAGGYLICTYFFYCGRMPDRIVVSVLLYCTASVFLSLTGNDAESRNGTEKRSRIKPVYSVLICLSAVPFVISWFNNFTPEPSFALTAFNQPENTPAFYSEQEIYIWDSDDIDTACFAQLAKSGRLPSKDFMNHNIMAGDWTYGQKYLSDHFSSAGISNPAVSLMERPHTYYVGDHEAMIKTYLSEHYDYDTEPVKIKDISGVPVWSFQHPNS